MNNLFLSLLFIIFSLSIFSPIEAIYRKETSIYPHYVEQQRQSLIKKRTQSEKLWQGRPMQNIWHRPWSNYNNGYYYYYSYPSYYFNYYDPYYYYYYRGNGVYYYFRT